MPKHLKLSEQELAEVLSARLGVSVGVEEVEDFLHDEFPYEERVGMHDVLRCHHPKCNGGVVTIETRRDLS